MYLLYPSSGGRLVAIANIQMIKTTPLTVFIVVLNCFTITMLWMTQALSTVMAVKDQIAEKPDTMPITP